MSEVGRVFINEAGGGGRILPVTIPDDPPPPADTVAYLALLVDDGAVAVWPLDENDGSTTYADAVGSLDLTLNRQTTGAYASDAIGPGGAASPFFAGNGYLSTDADNPTTFSPTDALIDVGTGEFALECWASLVEMTYELAALGFLVSLMDDGASMLALFGYGGPNSGANNGQLVIHDGVTNFTASRYDDGVVRHLVVTRRADTWFIIVNGEEVLSAPVTSGRDYIGSRVRVSGIDYSVGIPGNNAYVPHARVSWAAFYPVSLSESQALAHYTAGIGG